jgi:hypothetical protein
MLTVAPTIAQSANTRQWVRYRVIAKYAGSEGPVLTSMGAHCATLWTVALKRSIFKRKEGSRTLV